MSSYSTGLPEQRRLEWEAELRMLIRKRQEDSRRIEELEEILNSFWGNGR